MCKCDFILIHINILITATSHTLTLRLPQEYVTAVGMQSVGWWRHCQVTCFIRFSNVLLHVSLGRPRALLPSAAQTFGIRAIATSTVVFIPEVRVVVSV